MTILDYIRIAFDTVVLLFFCYVVYRFYLEWQEHAGLPLWQRLLTSCLHSATIVWTKVCVVVATIIAFILNISDFLGVPEVRTFFESWIGNPKVLSAIILSITAVTYFARMRKLTDNRAFGFLPME